MFSYFSLWCQSFVLFTPDEQLPKWQWRISPIHSAAGGDTQVVSQSQSHAETWRFLVLESELNVKRIKKNL